MRVPEGWRQTTVGDVLERVAEPVVVDPSQNYQEIGIRSHGKGLFDKEPVPGAVLGEKRVFWIQPDCFILNIVFAWERAVGRTTVEDTGKIASHRFPMYRPKSGLADVDYLLHFFKTERGRELLALASPGGAGRNKTLGQKEFLKLPLCLPPLHEQKRIAEILFSVDEAIETTLAVIERTGKVKQGILNRLLTRGFGHARFKQTQIGEIPEAWEVRSLDQLGQIQAGRQRSPHFTEGTLHPYLRVANVFDGFIDTSDVLQMNFTGTEYERYRLEPGDILLNEGQSLELVGRNAVYEGVPTGCCFQNTLVRFRSGPDVQVRFAYALMQHLFLTGKFMAIATRTTSVAHLGVKRFAGLLVPLPTRNEQLKISEIHDQFTRAINSQMKKYKELLSLRAALMSDLLTGRKRVSADALSPAL